MLIVIPEHKMFVDVLNPMEWRSKTGDRGKFIGLGKCSFAFLKVLKADTFNLHRVPMELASPVVHVSMKGGDDAAQIERRDLRA